MVIPTRIVNEILALIRSDMAPFGGYLHLDRKNHDLPDCDEPGYFTCEGDKPVISVAIGSRLNTEWLPMVLHEYSHFQQWKEDSLVWRNCFIGTVDVSDIANLWIDGIIDLPGNTSLKIFGSLAKLEYEAEKNTIKLMRRFDLQMYVDITRYIMEANVYISSYFWARYYRIWFPQLWKDEKLVDLMPVDLIDYVTPEASKYVHNKIWSPC
jgi:hypothetical protein